jgi:predicted RNA-binding Zn ribbon-like protein
VDFSHYSHEPVQIAVDLVNTVDVVDGSDRLNRSSDVVAFLNQYDDGWPDPVPQVDDHDLAEIRALRSKLRAVFEAKDEAVAAAALNTLLAEVGASPRVSTHSGLPHLHFEPTPSRLAHWIGAVTAMGLSVVLIEDGLERFGTCASTTCDDVYVDTSRNRSRRHCSDTCSTRENVAAYRRRQQAG